MADAKGAMLRAAETKVVTEDETEAASGRAPAPAPVRHNAEIRLSDDPGPASLPAFGEQEGRHGHRRETFRVTDADIMISWNAEVELLADC